MTEPGQNTGASGEFAPGDRVRGSWDPATVVSVEGEGHNARVLVEWDKTDVAGVYRPEVRRTVRLAWTLTHIDSNARGE